VRKHLTYLCTCAIQNVMSTSVIILAAGKGKRMGASVPKPLVPLNGKPVVSFLLDSVRASGVSPRPVIVIGTGAELVRETLGPDYEYVVQEEQLGTGHAVKVCRDALEGKADTVIVLYADHPFVTAETIQTLENLHKESGATMSLMTVKIPDFEDWKKSFYSYGRVKRNEKGEIIGNVEFKDCTEEEKKIREVTSFFCFQAEWLWKNLDALKDNNAQGEYYLTDLLGMAFAEQKKIAALQIEPKIAIGINTAEELAIAASIIEK
jgi:bifunctional UDP-N-acetylglucosamine pyrophosphorylase / glucosamine-1-phosphate N-acetyltransferase